MRLVIILSIETDADFIFGRVTSTLIGQKRTVSIANYSQKLLREEIPCIGIVFIYKTHPSTVLSTSNAYKTIENIYIKPQSIYINNLQNKVIEKWLT